MAPKNLEESIVHRIQRALAKELMRARARRRVVSAARTTASASVPPDDGSRAAADTKRRHRGSA